ncbi:MAG: ATP-binding cassette domain-containing protein [Verrucomicrobia bacterium]|nr:ATP-binding cassette domain-containing protein [Verrucomicrobiota bacterium]
MGKSIIEAHGLGKQYRLGILGARTLREDAGRLVRSLLRREVARGPGAERKGFAWALRDVSFNIAPGEAVGFIGGNGAGKSTLLKLLARITEPSAGSAKIRGKVAALLEVGSGFHNELTGRENIFLNAAILGMPRAATQRKLDEIIDFSGVEKYIDTPVKRYSSGMRVRLAFAVAAFLEPDILIADEVLAVGDANFQKKSLGKMSDVARQGRTVLFVSHDLAAVQNLCRRVIVLQKGSLLADGPAAGSIRTYLGSLQSARTAQVGTGPRQAAADRPHLADFSVNQGPDTVEDLLLSGRQAVLSFALRRVEPDVHCCVEIYTETGVLVTRFATRGYIEGNFTGDVTLRCRTESLLLNPGRYRLAFQIFQRDALVEYHEHLTTFEVSHGTIGAHRLWSHEANGLFFFPHDWTAEPLAAEVTGNAEPVTRNE